MRLLVCRLRDAAIVAVGVSHDPYEGSTVENPSGERGGRMTMKDAKDEKLPDDRDRKAKNNPPEIPARLGRGIAASQARMTGSYNARGVAPAPRAGFVHKR